MPSTRSTMERARDELFSHINRCGVVKAAEEDQKHWMSETVEYLAERFPDLSDAELRELFQVGIRFCQPAVRRTPSFHYAVQTSETPAEAPADPVGALPSGDEQVVA